MVVSGKCVVPGCTTPHPQSTRFPTDPTMYNIWLEEIKNDDLFTLPQGYVRDNSRVCLKHFDQHSVVPKQNQNSRKRLVIRNAIPKLNLPTHTLRAKVDYNTALSTSYTVREQKSRCPGDHDYAQPYTRIDCYPELVTWLPVGAETTIMESPTYNSDTGLHSVESETSTAEVFTFDSDQYLLTECSEMDSLGVATSDSAIFLSAEMPTRLSEHGSTKEHLMKEHWLDYCECALDTCPNKRSQWDHGYAKAREVTETDPIENNTNTNVEKCNEVISKKAPLNISLLEENFKKKIIKFTRRIKQMADTGSEMLKLKQRVKELEIQLREEEKRRIEMELEHKEKLKKLENAYAFQLSILKNKIPKLNQQAVSNNLSLDKENIYSKHKEQSNKINQSNSTYCSVNHITPQT